MTHSCSSADTLGSTSTYEHSHESSDVEALRQCVIVGLLRRVCADEVAFGEACRRGLQSGVLTHDVLALDSSAWLPGDIQIEGGAGMLLDKTISPTAPTRLEQDFERLELLGRGSFGEVWRCRHRLDGQEYAVKAVCYRASVVGGDQVEQRVQREAQLWAGANHPHIARYHNSWVETKRVPVVGADCAAICDQGSGLALPMQCPPSPHGDFDLYRPESIGNASCSWYSTEGSEGGVVFGASEDGTLTPVKGGAQEHVLGSNGNFGHDCIVKKGQPYAKPPHKSECEEEIHATLYIQAELCDKETLGTLIAQRNASAAQRSQSPLERLQLAQGAIDIFRQCTSALAHLHDQGCAHRDVKPTNIFFASDGGVRLGDFGLAKLIVKPYDESVCSLAEVSPEPSDYRSLHTCGVGTPSYASPEQQVGGVYSVETDIYALGVIFAEMLCPAQTKMERAQLLEGLSLRRCLPEDVAKAFPAAAELVVSMTDALPARRPTAHDILRRIPILEAEVQEFFRNAASATAEVCPRDTSAEEQLFSQVPFPNQKCKGRECINIESSSNLDLCNSESWSASSPTAIVECDAMVLKQSQETTNLKVQPEYLAVCTGVPMEFRHAKCHPVSNISNLTVPLVLCSTGVPSVGAAFCVQWDTGGVPRPLSHPDKEIDLPDVEEAEILREFHLSMSQLGKGDESENERDEVQQDLQQHVDLDHADRQVFSAAPQQTEHKVRLISREIRSSRSMCRFPVMLIAALTPLMGAVQPPEVAPAFPDPPMQAQGLCADPGSEESSSAGVIDQ